MREIKFRICHETNSDKTIIYPDEHSDKYMIGIDGTVYENYGTKDKPLWENVFDATVFVQQYTGLKDKNGQEIYEGDIVEWQYKDNKERFTITYWEEDAMFLGKKDPDRHGGAERNWRYSKCVLSASSRLLHLLDVVVGNIFEGVGK
tara:strand:- start:209 stop:649 length:441 start_codon:yes stop_codon:yes gene_type:complete